MADDVGSVTCMEFDRRDFLKIQVPISRGLIAVWSLATVLGTIVTKMSVALAENPSESKSLLYAGMSLTVIAGYETIKHVREYRTSQRELATLDSHYQ